MGDDTGIGADSDVENDPERHAEEHDVAHFAGFLLRDGEDEQQRADTADHICPAAVGHERACSIGKGKEDGDGQDELFPLRLFFAVEKGNDHAVNSGENADPSAAETAEQSVGETGKAVGKKLPQQNTAGGFCLHAEDGADGRENAQKLSDEKRHTKLLGRKKLLNTERQKRTAGFLGNLPFLVGIMFNFDRINSLHTGVQG